MIDFYYWPTPNGDKVLIALEELGLAYHLNLVNILEGGQYQPAFLKISPNNKIPAIRINKQAIFESGAILMHLAEISGALMPKCERMTVLQWLFWQVGGLGPMAGQNHHFTRYAPEPVPYAIARYQKETQRLYQVLEQQLLGKEYIANLYSIADIACFTWVSCYQQQGITIEQYPNIHRWLQRIEQRPAVIRATKIREELDTVEFTEAHRKHFFK